MTVRLLPRQTNKYRARKMEVDGIIFASKAEARRYSHLKMLVRIGEIEDLEMQPRFGLVVNGQKVCDYVADFRYRVRATGATVVEDVKSAPTRTKEYRIKVRLLKALHGIEVAEVS